MRYLVYLARIFAIVIVGISTIGCEKKSDVSMSSTSVRTFTGENTSLSTGQISVYFSPYDIDQKYTLRLFTPTVEPLEGDGKKDVDYKITINAAHLSQCGVVVNKHAQRYGPFYVDGSREDTRFARITGVLTYSKYVVDEDQAQNIVSDLLDYDLTPVQVYLRLASRMPVFGWG